MGESYIRVPTDSTGKKVRTRQRTIGANTVEEQYVISVNERVVSFNGFTSTFRLAGSAANPINLMSMLNGASSAVLVGIRKLAVDVSVSATTAYLLTAYARLYRNNATTPSGGTALTKFGADSTQSSDANVTLLGPTSADGTATAITYSIPSAPIRGVAIPQQVTGVGEWRADDLELWSPDYPPLVLQTGESILVAHAGGVNSATHLHYTVKVWWEEYTTP